MNTEYYKKFEPVFNSWYIKRLIGEGSYGKVFEMEREDFGTTYKAALKAMTIPSNESEVKSIMADGMDEASVRTYYKNFVEDIVKEFVLMSKLKGNSNIVSYEDHAVIEHKDGIGWDILIRMELLTPLFDYIKRINLKRKDVIQLGIDMCKALELCQKYNIIHRDIKPENIFVSENGDYKLGDFGIARTLEQTSGMLSKKGTQAYMAPEIYREESYGSNVDIYSLGIVMYRLLNENRTPFLPAYPAPITHADREAAIKKRISGAPLPKPANADGRLAEIVLKACSYDPKERYFAPMEMREELEAILYNREEAKVIYPKGDDTPIKSLKYIKTEDEITDIKTEDRTVNIIGGGPSIDEKTGKTEGMFSRETEESSDETEGMFSKKKGDNSFDSSQTEEDKTESVFRDDYSRQKKKISIWKNRITYLVIVAVLSVVGICIFLVLNKTVEVDISETEIDPPKEETCSVSNLGEIENAIEINMPNNINDADYDIITNRLETYGKPYYINREDGITALSRDDLGISTNQILNAIHMIFGIGVCRFDSVSGSINALSYSDIMDVMYNNDSNRISVLLNEAGVEKLMVLSEEATATPQGNFINLYVDDNLICENIAYEINKNVIVIAESESLTGEGVKLLAKILEGRKLTANCEISIDEKYGLIVEEAPATEPTETTGEVLPRQSHNEGSGNAVRTPSKNRSSGTQTKTAPPVVQETPPVVQEAPPAAQESQPVVQEAPPVVQETPPVQQTAQDIQSESSNENNLPEFYVDF